MAGTPLQQSRLKACFCELSACLRRITALLARNTVRQIAPYQTTHEPYELRVAKLREGVV